MIHYCRDTPDNVIPLPGEKTLDVGMLMEWMFAWIKEFFEIKQERWDPGWIALVNAPREMKKAPEVLSAADRNYAHLREHELTIGKKGITYLSNQAKKEQGTAYKCVAPPESHCRS
jgi:hypothetical protein